VSPRFVPDRPERVRFPAMFQGWHRITFLHWPCDAGLLQARLPGGLTIDTYGDAAWIGLTPFHLTDLRPPFLPAIPGLSDFPEMNLRTYVRGPAGAGIWFFSLDAASLPAVLGARLSYGLPYHWATMQVISAVRRVRYESVRAGAAAAITVEVGEPLPDPDDLTLFLTERYRLYTRLLGRLAMAPVEHQPWPLHRARLVETVTGAAGLPGGGRPALVHWSPGVRVRVGWPRRPPSGPWAALEVQTHRRRTSWQGRGRARIRTPSHC
jgi:uncharacterized protein YqjF (DUF2071 family)